MKMRMPAVGNRQWQPHRDVDGLLTLPAATERGSVCFRGHSFTERGGAPFSIRYKNSGVCMKCSAWHSKNRAFKKESKSALLRADGVRADLEDARDLKEVWEY